MVAELTHPAGPAQGPAGAEVPPVPGKLHRSLGTLAITSQGVAAIGLTGTALVNIPQAVAIAGERTWVCYGVASLVILLVAETLITFRKVPAAADGIAGFVRDRFGDRVGDVAAWTLLLGYVGNTLCCLTVFGVYLDHFFARAGAGVWPVAGYLVGGLLCYGLARRDVQLSAMTMLATELLSVVVVLILCALILLSGPDGGGAPGVAGATLPFESLQAGVMLALLSFVGFESTATLGQESVDPLRAIPRSIRWSVWISVAVFLFWAYVLPIGLQRLPAGQRGGNSALILLADQMRRPGAATMISVGGFLCFFGATLANLTALGRVTFALAGRGFLPGTLARVDARSHTPVPALTASAGVVIGICCGLSLAGRSPHAMFDSTGTFAVLGFLGCYLLVAITAAASAGPHAGWSRLVPIVTVLALLVASAGFVAGSIDGMWALFVGFAALFLLGLLRAWARP